MYVCICKGITDTQIRAAVEDGASSMRDVRNTLGVASQCGKCGILTREIVRESLDDQAASQQLFQGINDDSGLSHCAPIRIIMWSECSKE